MEKLIDDAYWASATPDTNVYVLLDRPNPELLQRADNMLSRGAATKSQEIARRRQLLIDLDPIKHPDHSNDSATDQEKDAVIDIARQIVSWLTSQGFPPPVVSDSGSGAHLFYAVDLPNTREVTSNVKQFLLLLAKRFDIQKVRIDTAVHDPNRICKLPGTVARKGQHTADRPHRTSRLLYCPDIVEAVSLELLQKVMRSEEVTGGSDKPCSPKHRPRRNTTRRSARPGRQPVGHSALLEQRGLAFSHRADTTPSRAPLICTSSRSVRGQMNTARAETAR